MATFGMVLQLARKVRGMEQKTLADKTGVSRSYLSRVELGLKPPLAGEAMQRVVEVLQLSEEEKHRLEAARALSAVRFQLPKGLTPMQVELANRFHQVLARLTPQQVSVLNTQLLNEQESRGSKPQIR